jgi:LPS-assembly lipoprotein
MLSSNYKKFRALAPVLLCLVLAACGFHLRGVSSMPKALSVLNLDCAGGQHLCGKLTRELEASGVTLQTSAPYTLTVSKIQSTRRAVAFTATATAAEYEITQSAEFLLTDESKIPIVKGHVNTQQNHQYDNSVLAKNREEQQIIDDLDSQLASRIVSRLSPYDQIKIDTILKNYQPDN